MTKKPEDADPPRVSAEGEICGIIMPISATASHAELHWRQVQQVLHRAVEKAGLRPQNVWSGEATDRITTRILSSLFDHPVAVCDISDLNPNVMLELGMRLTSKKPTVVVVERGGTIPFDIADFEALPYPPDLNIIETEEFIENLAAQVSNKLEASKSREYVPFLQDVITTEFLTPEHTSVPFEEFVTSRLDTIMDRIENLERRSRPALIPSENALSALRDHSMAFRAAAKMPGRIFVALKDPSQADEAVNFLLQGEGVQAVGRAPDGRLEVHLRTIGILSSALLQAQLTQRGIETAGLELA